MRTQWFRRLGPTFENVISMNFRLQMVSGLVRQLGEDCWCLKNVEGNMRDSFSNMSSCVWKSDFGGSYREEKLGLGKWKFLRLTSTNKIKSRHAMYIRTT